MSAQDPEQLLPSFESLENLPADPHLTINPGRSTFLGAYPSTFPTYRAGVGSDASSDRQAPSEGSLAELEELTGIHPAPTSVADVELTKSLAQGGFGEVWLGEQRSLQRTVAVKRLRNDQLLGATPDQRQAMRFLFQQEALTTARLEHPNIVPVYQLLTDRSENPLLSMKWVKGRAWNDILAAESDQPVGEFLARHLAILIDVSQAVAFAHSQGILHRDIKPHQVMVGEFGEVLLMDWGLAIPFGEVAAEDDTPDGDDTSGGSNVSAGGFPGPAGTPSFMAPEQAHGDFERFGPWTDLYLLGGVLYFLLTGTAPHKAPTSMAALLLAAKSEVPPPSERVADRHLPQDLVDLAMSTLQADPQRRSPHSVSAFIEALQGYLSGASRRRRARALLIEVTGEAPGADYVHLEEQLARLRQADVLWPEHPDMASARDRLLCAYLETALEQKDLTLARVQAEQLEDAELRRDGLRRLGAALQKRREEAQQRRWALGGLVAVLLLLVAGGFKYAYDQQQANERLLAQRDEARQARRESEGLMSFMMQDLWDRLSEIERVDILSSVATRAQSYYAQRDLHDLNDEETMNLGTSMAKLSDVLANTGQFAEAIETQQRAEQVFAQLANHPELGPAVRRERLLGRLTLANHYRDMGESEIAEPRLRQVLQEIEAWLVEAPRDEEWLYHRALALDSLGILLYDQGHVQQAKASFEASEAQMLALHQDAPERWGIDAVADVTFRIGITLMDLGRWEDAVQTIRGARAQMAEALQREPNQRDRYHQMTFFDTALVELLVRQGKEQEAKELAWVTLTPMRQLLEQDPQNIELRYTIALLELALGNAETLLASPGRAQAAWRRGVADIEAVADLQPATDHTYVLDTLVRLLLALGETERARPRIEALCQKGWDHQEFSKLCVQYGVGERSPIDVTVGSPTDPTEARGATP